MIPIHSTSFLVAVFCCLTAAAQTNSLQIKGPNEVVPGQLVRLDAQLEPNESPFWIVLSPTDLDYEQVEAGSRLIFAVDCDLQDSITVMLLAQQVKNDRIVTRQIRRTILVAKPDPDTPGNGPEIDLQESPLFAAVSTAWDSIHSEIAKSKTDLVAKNFELVADLCKSGSIKARPEIWKRLSDSNLNVLAEHIGSWEPVGAAMQEGFKQLQLKTIQEHSFHFRAIASALRSKSQ